MIPLMRISKRMVQALIALVATLVVQTLVADDVLPNNNSFTKEIRYRELFFNYYRKDFFTALTTLAGESSLRRLPNHEPELDLLRGSLFFSYGMQQDSEVVLRKLAMSSSKSKHRDLAWFYLARMYYQQGNVQGAEESLRKVGNELPAALHAEKQYLNLMLFVAKGRFDSAEKYLDEIDENSEWLQYARFNLGAAYIKSGSSSKGEDHINEVGKLQSDDDELLSLRDKANLTLGYYNLRNRRSEDAINYFERVRSDSPFTNKALLGMGWAFAQDKIFDRALVPWLHLSQKSIYDVTVQESLLASSYAYSQSGAEKKALLSYNDAIERYKSMQKYINDSILDVQRGRVTGAILTGNEFDDFAITTRLRGITNRENGHLIVALLQDDDFQRLLRTYRDLRFLHAQIDRWRQDIRTLEIALPASINQRSDVADRERVLRQKTRIDQASKRLNETLDEFEKKLQDTMVEKLEQQQQYVTTYLSQAKLAIAQLFDTSSREGVKK